MISIKPMNYYTCTLLDLASLSGLHLLHRLIKYRRARRSCIRLHGQAEGSAQQRLLKPFPVLTGGQSIRKAASMSLIINNTRDGVKQELLQLGATPTCLPLSTLQNLLT